ncbi:MAG: S8 family serine peptidase [Brevefilum sp.]|nr:S8 family serine peptidase [Brevefilum sp.]
MSRKLLTFVVVWCIFAIALSASVTPVAGSKDDNVRVWVTYQSGRQAEVRESLDRQNAQVHYDFPQLEAYVVTLPASALNGILRNPFVEGVEEDPVRYPIEPVKADPQAINADSGQTIPWGIDAVQARDVWDADRNAVIDPGAPTGAGVTVCIIDTGYYVGHEDLKAEITGKSQVDNDYKTDGAGHGSHVAGTIGALNNGLGVVGVSPGMINYHIVKIFNNDGVWTSSSDLVAAIYECQSGGANVISMSLGGTFKSRTEEKAFNALYSGGILHVASAGNDGNTRLSYPASYSSVISVAAVDSDLVVADFSQKNSSVELAAPGVSVLSTVPFVDVSAVAVADVTYNAFHIENAARGTTSGALVNGGLCNSTGSWSGQVVLCQRGEISFYDKVINVQNGGGAAALVYNNEPGSFYGTLGDGSSSIIALSLSQEDGGYLVANKIGVTANVTSTFISPGSGYEAWDGTSMAAPHVSGVAALIWSADLTLTNIQIRDAMNATAFDLGAAGRDNAYGYGLVQAYDAWVYLGGGGGGTTDDPPTVSITSPVAGATVSDTVSILATARDDVGVSQVEFFVDGKSIGFGMEGSDSWSISWVTTGYADGSHTVKATATDTIGQKADSDDVTVTVDNDGGGTTDPILLGSNGYKVKGKKYVDLNWTGAISTNVDVYRNNTLYITIANNGAYTAGSLGVGGGSDTFYICEAGTNTCSNEVTIKW